MSGILEFQNVLYHYQDGRSQNVILQDASYSFETGKIYAIEGGSGSGKKTIVLAEGLDKPKSGSVLFNGQNIQDIGFSKYRQKNVSMSFDHIISFII
ncbi:MAG: ATP-binding cassette domain-containing protein [Succinatimonas sp.]|nr:ATP-binding cassette domain-containing protein [Succinatimonas sp.]